MTFTKYLQGNTQSRDRVFTAIKNRILLVVLIKRMILMNKSFKKFLSIYWFRYSSTSIAPIFYQYVPILYMRQRSRNT